MQTAVAVHNAAQASRNLEAIAGIVTARWEEIAKVIALGAAGIARIGFQAVMGKVAATAEAQYNATALAAFQIRQTTASHAATAAQ